MIIQLFFTVRYLRLRQIVFRLWYFIYRPRFSSSKRFSVNSKRLTFLPSGSRVRNQLDVAHLEFLIHTRRRNWKSPKFWNAPGDSKLWLYNLHYFDFLADTVNADNSKIAVDIMAGWVHANPFNNTIGWDPYPTSRRILNWIWWTSFAGNKLDQNLNESLFAQADLVSKKIEYHLLGNHVLVNAFSLLAAGSYFSGPAPEKWLKKGRELLISELKEQVLVDGEHYERSFMYQDLIIEDLAVVLLVLKSYDGDTALEKLLSDTLCTMIKFSDRFCTPNDGLPIFNDVAESIALPKSQLRQLCFEALGQNHSVTPKAITKSSSGFVKLRQNRVTVFVDGGSVKPDYQPGHAHAGTLSFELWIDDVRLFMNGGVSTYEPGDIRVSERSTFSKNSVAVNNSSSSYVWRSFRVGSRARVEDLNILAFDNGHASISASHDGFSSILERIAHQRDFILRDSSIRIVDRIYGGQIKRVQINFWLTGDLQIVDQNKTAIHFMHRHITNVEFKLISKGGDMSIKRKDRGVSFGVQEEAWVVSVDDTLSDRRDYEFELRLLN